MAELPHARERTLALSAKFRHDELCDEFEAAWQAGGPTPMEDFLARVPPAQRPLLFAEMLRLEIELRKSSPASPDEYRARFPEYGDVVESIFRDPSGESSGIEDAIKRFAPPSIPGIEIINRIGEGGMGVVYLARHLHLNRLVAVKMIKIGPWTRPRDLTRFELEAHAVARLNHPNVVQIYDRSVAEGVPYLVMEYVATGSLSARLKGEPQDQRQSAELVQTLARAVQHCHDRKIIHRDLKPANILLAADGTPKLADFGLAKRLTSDGPNLTATRAVMGTASYMPPEQADGRVRDVGPLADVYSLGAVFFELLTGRPPFRAATFELTVVQVLTQDPPRPTDLVPGLSAELEAVCLKCLEKDPARRYASAAALADDLAAFRDGRQLSVAPLRVIDQDTRWAQRIGYDIIDQVSFSRGAFVYTARKRGVPRTVLLKRCAGKAGSAAHAALRAEAEALAELDHPNIIRLIDAGESGDQSYLITEYVESGLPLNRCRRQSQDGEQFLLNVPCAPFAPRRATEVALRVALGLQAVHEHGFAHGALNPTDIILTPDDAPKIASFVAARRLGARAGTIPPWVAPNYLAPELLAGNGAVLTPAADIYGLGAVLYDMLVGLPPFAAGDAAAVREGVLRRPPLAPPAAGAVLPPRLEAICLKCLAKSPAERYPGAAALLLDLQMFLASPNESSDATAPRDGERRRISPSAYQLRIERGPHDVGKVFRLSEKQVVIGRQAHCELSLRDEKKTVSKLHCGLVWNADLQRHELIDYGSLNGTAVNDRRIVDRTPLAPDDRIGITLYTLVFEVCSDEPL